VNEILRLPEKYHLFRRGQDVCRWGAYGLTREYFPAGSAIPPEPERVIEIPLTPPRVRTMQAVITSQCNLRCSYCSFDANAPPLTRPAMSREEIAALAREFNRDLGPGGLLLITGGEPELYREAVDHLVETVRGKIIIFTNGTRTERSRLRFYRDHGVGVLFSLDGDLFAHNTARIGAGGSYTKVARALKEACDLGLDYGISAVVGDHNIATLPELVEAIVREFRPASLGLNLPHHHHGQVWDRLPEYTEALIRIFPFAREHGLFVDQINRRLAPLVHRKFRLRDCAAQGEKIVVFPGNIRTTCVNEAGLKAGGGDWSRYIPLLNVECRDCAAIGICGGGCIFDGQSIYGVGAFDRRNCYFSTRLLEYIIWELWDSLGENATDPEHLQLYCGSLLMRGSRTYFSVGHETGD